MRTDARGLASVLAGSILFICGEFYDIILYTVDKGE